MRSIRVMAAACLALFAGVAAAQQPRPSAPVPVAAATKAVPITPAAGSERLTKADVDAWLDGFMPFALRNGDMAGAVVVVVKDGQVVTQRGFGYADMAKRTPVDPETTLFRPGSVSKLVTWTAVMQQVEAGRIDLDADINRYLDFKIPARNGKPITMRQMMTHTAGFEDRAKDISFYDADHKMSLGAYLKADIPNRIFEPGTTPAYSNYATTLAAYVVERVSGTPFDAYVEQRIFAPLGMAHSTFRQPVPAPLAPMVATGYRKGSDKPIKFEIIGPGPAGGLSATGADMGRFMIAHLQDGAYGEGRIMQAATAQTMHQTALTILPRLNRMELGFFETNLNGRQIIGHLGDIQGFHTALHLFPAEKTGIYVSLNAGGRQGAASAIRGGLLLDFANRYFPGPPLSTARVDAKTTAQHAAMMAGLWQGSRRVDTGFMVALGVIGQTKVSVGPKGELVIPDLKDAGGAARKWVEIEPFVWREVNGQEKLSAQVVDGRVVRWSVDSVSPFTVFDRVPAAVSSAWLMPAVYVSLGVLALTFLQWPAAAVIRRRFRADAPVTGGARWVNRGTKLISGLVLVTLIAWMLTATGMMKDFSQLTSVSDGKLWTLHIVGLVVFVAAILISAVNLVLTWRGKRGWTARVWSILLLLSTLLVLYMAHVFGLLDMTVNY